MGMHGRLNDEVLEGSEFRLAIQISSHTNGGLDGKFLTAYLLDGLNCCHDQVRATYRFHPSDEVANLAFYELLLPLNQNTSSDDSLLKGCAVGRCETWGIINSCFLSPHFPLPACEHC